MAERKYSNGVPVVPHYRLLSKWLNQMFQQNDKNIPKLKDYLQNKQGMTEQKIDAVRTFAFKVIKEIAENTSNSLAHYMLAQCYEKVWGVEKNPELAFHWAQKSARAGNSWGMCAIGLYYQMELGCKKDDEEGFKWVKRAAEQGHSHSLFNLGILYQNGHGTPEDKEKALECFQKGAELGNVYALSCLGFVYAQPSNPNTAPDFAKSFECHLKAAKLNSFNSMNTIGCYHELGIGTKHDLEQALYWFLRAEKAGETECAPTNLTRIIQTHGLEAKRDLIRRQIDEEDREKEMLPDVLRVMLIGYFKEENCVFYCEYVPFEIFHLILEHSGLIR